MEICSENLNNFDTFHDHHNKCRCCFKRFEKNRTKIGIMKLEQNIYEILTDVELKMSSNLAKFLCYKCDAELQKFFKFREKAREIQNKYYEFVGDIWNQKSQIGSGSDHLNQHMSFESSDLEKITEASNNSSGILDSTIETLYSLSQTTETLTDYSRLEKEIRQQPEKIRDCFVRLERIDISKFQQSIKSIDSNEQDESIEMTSKTSSTNSNLLIINDIIEIKNSEKDEQKNNRPVESIQESLSDIDIISNVDVRSSVDLETFQNPTRQTNSNLVDLETFRDPTHSSDISNTLNFDDFQNFLKPQRKNRIINSSVIIPTNEKNVASDELSENNLNLRYACDICGKNFPKKSSLQVHMRFHTGKIIHDPQNSLSEKPFKCGSCGKRFYTLSDLKKHMKIHTIKKRFECKTCGKGFFSSSNLKTHMRIHTGEKPFECKTCGKAFSQSANLKTHIRTHASLPSGKPFKCETCGHGFSSSAHLKIHMRIHTGEKPFECPTCDKRFNRSWHLKRHMKTHTI